MRARVCQIALAAMAAGCFQGAVSGVPGAPDAGEMDPGGDMEPVDFGRLDAAPGDAGPVPECPARDPDFFCVNEPGGSPMPIGRGPFDLPIFVGNDGRCYCGEDVSCDARVARDGSVDLTTGLCGEGPICGACFPNVSGSCAVPALEVGRHDVRINGRLAFQVEVRPEGPRYAFFPACTRPAPEPTADVCGSYELSGPGVSGIDTLCHPSEVAEFARADLRVSASCGSCTDAPGSCEVIVEDSTLRVVPQLLEGQCDVDCPPACFEHELRCITPPLPEGSYVVRVEGGPASRLEVIATAPTPVEVCVGP